MKLTIAIAASAFLLSGCLESSSSTPANVQPLETTTGATTGTATGGTATGGTATGGTATGGTATGGTATGGTATGGTATGGTATGGTATGGTATGGTATGGTATGGTATGGTATGGTATGGTATGGSLTGGLTTGGGTTGGQSSQTAVASMLVNDQGSDGSFQNYWSCTSNLDDSPFLIALSDSGEGVYESSEGSSFLTWSETTNGTVSFNLTDVDIFVEWTNFNFISLFEFTADLYEDGELIETDRCNLLDVEDEIDNGGGTNAAENFFVTAQDASDPNASRFIWACLVQDEFIFFTFFADKTGLFLFSGEDDELEIVPLNDWQFADGSLNAFSPDFSGSIVSLNGVTTGSNDTFTASETIVGTTALGESDCFKFDSDE